MHRTIALSALLLVVASVAVVGATTASDYSVDVTPDVDTPNRTVSFHGNSNPVSEIGRVDPGGTLTVDVSAPSDASYAIDFYTADRRQQVTSADGSGDTTTSFTMAYRNGRSYAPGTYVAVVSDGESVKSIQPVVVSGYHVSVEAPDGAATGERIDVRADVSTVDDREAIDEVQVVIGNAEEQQRVPLAALAGDDGSYGGTVALEGLSEGDYWLYVVVQGDQQVFGDPASGEPGFGQAELLGLSDSQSFSIEQGSTTGSTDGSEPGAPSESSTPADATTDGNQQSVITPAATTEAATDDGQPLDVLPPLLVAAFAVAMIAWRR